MRNDVSISCWGKSGCHAHTKFHRGKWHMKILQSHLCRAVSVLLPLPQLLRAAGDDGCRTTSTSAPEVASLKPMEAKSVREIRWKFCVTLRRCHFYANACCFRVDFSFHALSQSILMSWSCVTQQTASHEYIIKPLKIILLLTVTRSAAQCVNVFIGSDLSLSRCRCLASSIIFRLSQFYRTKKEREENKNRTND